MSEKSDTSMLAKPKCVWY